MKPCFREYENSYLTSTLLNDLAVGQRHFDFSDGGSEFFGHLHSEFVRAQKIVDSVQHAQGRVTLDGLLVVSSVGNLRTVKRTCHKDAAEPRVRPFN